MCALLQPRPVSAASPPYLSWIQGGKKLKQNRAKSRIAWNNVVPANVHEEDWPPSIVMGAWLQSTLHTGPAPCLYQYLSSACAHRHTVLSTVPRITDARVSPETVNFIANRYLWIVEPPSFHPTLVAIFLKIRVIFRISLSTVLKNSVSRRRDSDKLINLLLLRFLIS